MEVIHPQQSCSHNAAYINQATTGFIYTTEPFRHGLWACRTTARAPVGRIPSLLSLSMYQATCGRNGCLMAIQVMDQYEHRPFDM